MHGNDSDQDSEHGRQYDSTIFECIAHAKYTRSDVSTQDVHKRFDISVNSKEFNYKLPKITKKVKISI